MRITKSSFALIIILALGILPACKKDKDASGTPPPPPATSAADKIKDSVLLYAKDIYLWYNQIPSTFNPRNYADPDAIMKALRQYSKEPGFTQPVDLWSFAMKKAEWDNVQSGIAGDFGLGIFFHTNDDLRVKAVEKESPAGKAGIRRGWRITKINGNSTINTSDASINFIVKNVFESTTTSFTFQKPDGSSVDITLTATTYREEPIFLDSVYTIDSKKIGYLVFNSFLGDTTKMYNDFQRIFTRFTQAGVNDVVVDLRYNGGGYVSVAQRLSNYLVNTSATGQLMMKQEYNNKYSQYNSSVNFNKLGSLNLNRIFFIVSSSTASASEMLINNLKPFMEVFIVGPSKTLGKPVGFFPIPVGDWYIFPVSSRSTNKNGEGSYFTGFPLNFTAPNDGLDKDWGDVNETNLRIVLNYITTGTFRLQARDTRTKSTAEQPQVKQGNLILDEPNFKGAVHRGGVKINL
ncbi:MAG: S41 family peptidase [Chitinophagaceae bacterium]